MNPIETLRHHNEWRRGSCTEMLNPTELGIVIDTVIADYEAMQKQNNELRANSNKLRESLRDACMYLVCTIDCKKYNKVLKATPAQSLADIRAEAVIEFNESLVFAIYDESEDYEKGFDDALSQLDQHAKKYANRIKEG